MSEKWPLISGLRRALAGLVLFLAFVPGVSIGQVSPGSELPVSFSADRVEYDREAGVITATSNVEVTHEGAILLADKLSYNQNADQLSATGNVSLMDVSGDVYFASSMTLSGDMKNGVAQDMRALFADESRLAAKSARRRDGVVMEWDRAVYSPCKPCRENPDRPLLWQLKAVKVRHDQTERVMEYKDVWLEIAGVPVFYTPYFRYPDPSVKRKTGFLIPSWTQSTDLGTAIRAPFYWDMAPDKGATITPVLTSKAGSGAMLEYDQRLTNGEINFDGSFIQDEDKTTSGEDLNDGRRWHIAADGKWHLDETWRAGLKFNRASDGSYFDRYAIEGDDIQESRLYLEGFRGRNYMLADSYMFQDLRTDSTEQNIPLVLPWLEYSYDGAPGRFGQKQTFDVSFVSLARESDRDVSRLSAKGAWNMPFLGSDGSVFNFGASLRGDGYFISDYTPDGGQTVDGFEGRIFPQAALEWRRPMIRDQGLNYQMLEPRASLVIAPNGGNPDEIPNEDSLGLQYDDTNIFALNRYPGLDRVEGGSRINYGVNWGVYGQGGGKTTLSLGQSYKLSRDSDLPTTSGLEEHFTDIVGRLEYAPTDGGRLYYRTRRDKDDLSALYHAVGANAEIQKFELGLNYSYLIENPEADLEEREQVYLSVGREISEYWRADSAMLYDLADDGGLRSLRFSFTYDDECTIFKTSLVRSYFENSDVKPASAILFEFSLKFPGGSVDLSPFVSPALNQFLVDPLRDDESTGGGYGN